ncbi:MAG: DUF5024 domain-containing protein [Dysgonamonadaceae bacterium]|jgi:lipopolysaccharide export LptBFGC system permease protein LptF|nr:DUF5024 domain-containing protein [Dysgonamonadaceae bacterium]
MKTKRIYVSILVLLTGFISSEVIAQSTIDALIKKCETLESIDMEVIKNKKKGDKEAENRVVSIRITDDQALVEEFIAAFTKDSDNADQQTIRKSKNKALYSLKFGKVDYTLNATGNKNARITVRTGSFFDSGYILNPLRFFDGREFDIDSMLRFRDSVMVRDRARRFNDDVARRPRPEDVRLKR